MVAPAAEGIDLFKIAGRSISGWIPSFKTGAASHVRQPFCSQLEERLLPNRAMTLFTPLGPSADCRGPTQVTTYQGRTDNARVAAFAFCGVVPRCSEVYRVKSHERPTRV